VRMSARLAFMMAALTTLAATSLVWLAPEALVSVFLEGGEADNQLVLETALALSGAAGLFLLLDGTQLVIANTIRGLRDTRSPLWISLAGYWLVGLGSGIVLCFPLGYGAHGLWWGLVAGVVLCNLLLYRRFRQHVASGLPAEAP
jgi:MATE family multidrug resistance protein